jgi:hypothetical protein
LPKPSTTTLASCTGHKFGKNESSSRYDLDEDHHHTNQLCKKESKFQQEAVCPKRAENRYSPLTFLQSSTNGNLTMAKRQTAVARVKRQHQHNDSSNKRQAMLRQNFKEEKLLSDLGEGVCM